jgi:hypothetical protein
MLFFSITCAGTIGLSHVKIMNLDTDLTPFTKNDSKWNHRPWGLGVAQAVRVPAYQVWGSEFKHQKTKNKAIKLIKKNIENLSDL